MAREPPCYVTTRSSRSVLNRMREVFPEREHEPASGRGGVGAGQARSGQALSMFLHFFAIPALDPGPTQDELNRFCQAQQWFGS